MNVRSPETRLQLGMSFVEILVAMAILVIAGTVALVMYDAARKSFKKGENVTEQQQAVRIAFDMLTSDLRLAGYNYNPDGDKNRPDEQIEAAYDTAVVLRADFDAEDPTASVTPEASLAGGSFLTVSTGNDEIVAYVLAKADGSSTDTLTFQADVKDQPRDGTMEQVSIPNVALVQNDPPYTLYRVTLNNDTSTWGSSSFITRTPVVDNVRWLRFRYYNQAGTQVNSTFNLTTVTDDIGGAEDQLSVNQRKSIRRIGIELEGLTRDPDLQWRDTADTNPSTRAYRKFHLSADVTPRNIGMVGVKDIMSDVTPPSKPATPTLVAGHCGGLYVSWTANPAADQVTSYRINYGTSTGSYSGLRTVAGTSYYLGSLNDATTYYVALQAVDAAGNVSVMSDEAVQTTSNTNTPEQPQNLAGSTGLNGAVNLSWDAVTTNTGATSGDPDSPVIRDLAGYRVYRGLTPNFNVNAGNRIDDEATVGAQANPSYTDTGVVNCRQYYYRVAAVDLCGVEGAASDSVPGYATSSDLPQAPVNVQAFLAGPGSVRVTWNATTQDVNNKQIFIDTYRVYRSDPVPVPDVGPPILPDPASFQVVGTASGATEYLDSVYTPQGYTVFYQVTAVDDCPNESARSQMVQPTCAFSGNVVFVNPQNNAPVAGVVPVQVQVQNGTDTYTQAELTFLHETDGQVTETQVVTGPGPWEYDWLANPPGPYTISATVTNTEGCARTESIHVSAGFDVGCCLSPPNPQLDPVIMTCTGPIQKQQECTEVTYEVVNNNCLTAVRVEGMTITWTDEVANNPMLGVAVRGGVRFDNTIIWNPTPQTSPAVATFGAQGPSIGVDRDITNPLQVTYIFDKVTSDWTKQSGYMQDQMTTTYQFRLLDKNGQPTAITGACGPLDGHVFHNLLVEAHK